MGYPRTDSIRRLPQTSALFASDSRLFSSIFEEDRYCVPLQQIAPSVIQALIATEDRRFYSHFGVDIRGILRAAYVNLSLGRLAQGGSTVTQQLARMAVLRRRDRTVRRKLLEIYTALILERHFSKEKILEAYLNAAYFGHNIHGIELAALSYCKKPAAALEQNEAAYLIGLLKAPGRYCQCCNPDRATDRSQLISKLAKFDNQTSTAREPEKKTFLKRRHYSDELPLTSGYVKECAKAWLTKYVPELYPSSRLIVHTTIDPICQSAIEAACSEVRSVHYRGRLACLIQDSRTGAIRGLSGGTDFSHHQFNAAINGYLQPGSLIKPFVLLAAVQKGIPIDYRLESRPLSISLGNGKTWTVKNAGDRYYGWTTIADALVHSDNTVYAQLLLEIGFERVLRILRAAQIPIKIATPSLSTGAIRPGVSPLQLCNAYSVFSNLGTFVDGTIITGVTDENCVNLWNEKARAIPVCSKADASTVVSVLKRVSIEGTGILPVPQIGLAAKTGTSVSGAWHMSFNDTYRLLTWTESDFLPVGAGQHSEKAVSAKALASRIWRFLAQEKLGFSELYNSFAGVDSMSIRDLLWVEEHFQNS